MVRMARMVTDGSMARMVTDGPDVTDVTDDPEDYDSIRAASDGSGFIGRKLRRVRIK